MFNIKKIEIIFENCEYAVIDGKHIGYFYAGDISDEYAVLGCNSFDHMRICHDFRMEVHKEAEGPNKGFMLDDTNLFERIERYSDITSIEIHTDDEKEPMVKLYVDWDGNDYNNVNQSCCISDKGHLYLTISEEKTVEDVFEEVLDDDEYRWGWMREEWGESPEDE